MSRVHRGRAPPHTREPSYRSASQWGCRITQLTVPTQAELSQPRFVVLQSPPRDDAAGPHGEPVDLVDVGARATGGFEAEPATLVGTGAPDVWSPVMTIPVVSIRIAATWSTGSGLLLGLSAGYEGTMLRLRA